MGGRGDWGCSPAERGHPGNTAGRRILPACRRRPHSGSTAHLPSLPPTGLSLPTAGKETNSPCATRGTPHPTARPGPAQPRRPAPGTHVLVVFHHPHRQRRVGPQAAPAGQLPAAGRRAAHAAAAKGRDRGKPGSAALPPSLPVGGASARSALPPLSSSGAGALRAGPASAAGRQVGSGGPAACWGAAGRAGGTSLRPLR